MRKSRGKQERGAKEAILERRRNVYALRAQGMSYRGIAEKLDISANSVFNDVQWCADNWGQIPENSKDAIRGQLVEVLRKATAVLVSDVENQAKNGQVTNALAADGSVIGSQQKAWVNPQSLAELGRTVERIAKVTGLMDTGIDATAGSVSNVQVVLPAPMGGVEFADASTKGALGPEGAVNTAAQAVPEEGHSSGPQAPEALT